MYSTDQTTTANDLHFEYSTKHDEKQVKQYEPVSAKKGQRQFFSKFVFLRNMDYNMIYYHSVKFGK